MSDKEKKLTRTALKKGMTLAEYQEDLKERKRIAANKWYHLHKDDLNQAKRGAKVVIEKKISTVPIAVKLLNFLLRNKIVALSDDTVEILDTSILQVGEKLLL